MVAMSYGSICLKLCFTKLLIIILNSVFRSVLFLHLKNFKNDSLIIQLYLRSLELTKIYLDCASDNYTQWWQWILVLKNNHFINQGFTICTQKFPCYHLSTNLILLSSKKLISILKPHRIMTFLKYLDTILLEMIGCLTVNEESVFTAGTRYLISY